METELNDTIEWLSKRVFIGKRDEEYIRFAIKEYASKYHETELKKLRVTDVSGSVCDCGNFSAEAYHPCCSLSCWYEKYE